MQKKYYIISTVDKNIYMNRKISLYDYTDYYFPKLTEMDVRGNFIRNNVGVIYDKYEYDDYKRKIIKFYKKLNLPAFLIAVGNDKCAKEIMSGIKLYGNSKEVLKRNQVDPECLADYSFEQYEQNIQNFFNPELIDINLVKPIIGFEYAKKQLLKKRFFDDE